MRKSRTIRVASLKDLDAISKIEEACFDKNTRYSKRQLRYLITKANSICIVEKSDDILHGFVIILFRKGTRVAGIETLDVHPEFRGKGVALTLLKAAEEEIKKRGIERIRLEVSTGNTFAIRVYEKAGFAKVAFLKDYYKFSHCGSKDAYRMVKYLGTQ